MQERDSGEEGNPVFEHVEIPGACRVPEENEHRLDVAKLVLGLAVGALEAEFAEDRRDNLDEQLTQARAGLTQTPPFKPGGYQ